MTQMASAAAAPVDRHVLVTGGAGYIGSHACKQLARAGYVPVTFDNLSTGWASAVKFGPLVQGDLLDRPALDAVFAEYQPVAVMHFAALSQVGEATRDPGRYWRNNLGGSLNLIEAMVAANCLDMVFSSTCATYGDQDGVVLNEDTPQHPLNALMSFFKDYFSPLGTPERFFVFLGSQRRARGLKTSVNKL